MPFEVYTFEFSDKIYAAETLNFRSASGWSNHSNAVYKIISKFKQSLINLDVLLADLL